MSALADDGWEKNILTLTLENDATLNYDRHYTAGARLTYLSADNRAPNWVQRTSRWLPALGFEPAALKWGLEIGQEIYTPANLLSPDLQVDDRPYAGWLYGGLSLTRRGPGPGPVWVMESLRLDLGVVGPEALGKEAQDLFHEADPRGWGHQLNTEIAFAFRYQRRYRLAWRSPQHDWGADLLPQLQANLGTVEVSLGAALQGRVGYQIPNEFAVGASPPRLGVYLFAGLGGKAVARNIFLDGNTFTESHHVPKEPWVGQATAGLTAVFKALELTFAHTFLTHEFKQQNLDDSYSSVFATLKF